MTDKRCGNCRLWAPNFHRGMSAFLRGTGCCADAKLDLPASWSSNTPMRSDEGEDCCAWEADEAPEQPNPNMREHLRTPWDEARSWEDREAHNLRVHGLSEDDLP